MEQPLISFSLSLSVPSSPFESLRVPSNPFQSLCVPFDGWINSWHDRGRRGRDRTDEQSSWKATLVSCLNSQQMKRRYHQGRGWWCQGEWHRRSREALGSIQSRLIIAVVIVNRQSGVSSANPPVRKARSGQIRHAPTSHRAITSL